MEDAQNGNPNLGVLAILALLVMVLCLVTTLLVSGSVLLYGVVTAGDTVENVDEGDSAESTPEAGVAEDEATPEPAVGDEAAPDSAGDAAEATPETSESGSEESGLLPFMWVA